MRRIARAVFTFDNPPVIAGCAAAVGKKEGEGPLGNCFDRVFEDNLLGEETWEKAESRLVTEAVSACLEKTSLTADDVDVIFTGDLLNQCIASTFGLRAMGVPHVGMYGACSTMASSLISAAVYTESGAAQRSIAVTSSHFSSSERQFRTPLQYGGQRTPTAQWTVTGSGAIVLEASGEAEENSLSPCAGTQSDAKVCIHSASIGTIEDLGVTDPCNMGAAMAPAAARTIIRHLTALHAAPEDYDLILTGDLGFVGSELLCELLLRENIDISKQHNDGGMMIYHRKEQDVHAGGSGCGCSASVLCGHVLPRMMQGELMRVLFVATGALMSPTSSFQGESIPGVAHALELQYRFMPQ